MGGEAFVGQNDSALDSLASFGADSARSVGKGIVGVGETVVGLGDIASFGGLGRGMESAFGYDPKGTREFISEFDSPSLQAARSNVAEAKGFLPSVEAGLRNPSAVVQGAIESAPSMIGGGAVGRGVLKFAPKLAPLVAGAFGEGVVSAGQAAEQTRQDTGTLTPAQAALAVSSGVVTAAISKLAGRTAQKLGLDDIDVLLAGGKAAPLVSEAVGSASQSVSRTGVKGLMDRAARIAGGFITEGGLEELPQSAQEQIHQNIAAGRPWAEGAAEAGASGMLAGGLMGGGANVFGGHSSSSVKDVSPPAAAAPDAEVDPNDPLAQQIQAKMESLKPADVAAQIVWDADSAGKSPVQALIDSGLAPKDAKATVQKVRSSQPKAPVIPAPVGAAVDKAEEKRRAEVQPVPIPEAGIPAEDAAAMFDDPLSRTRVATPAQEDQYLREAHDSVNRAATERLAEERAALAEKFGTPFDAAKPSQPEPVVDHQSGDPFAGAERRTAFGLGQESAPSESQRSPFDARQEQFAADQSAQQDAADLAFYQEYAKKNGHAALVDALRKNENLSTSAAVEDAKAIEAGKPRKKRQKKSSGQQGVSSQEAGALGGNDPRLVGGEVVEPVKNANPERIVAPGATTQPGEVGGEALPPAKAVDAVFGADQRLPATETRTSVAGPVVEQRGENAAASPAENRLSDPASEVVDVDAHGESVPPNVSSETVQSSGQVADEAAARAERQKQHIAETYRKKAEKEAKNAADSENLTAQFEASLAKPSERKNIPDEAVKLAEALSARINGHKEAGLSRAQSTAAILENHLPTSLGYKPADVRRLVDMVFDASKPVDGGVQNEAKVSAQREAVVAPADQGGRSESLGAVGATEPREVRAESLNGTQGGVSVNKVGKPLVADDAPKTREAQGAESLPQRLKVQARHLQAGDVARGSSETILAVAKSFVPQNETQKGKVEVQLRAKNGKERTAYWNPSTVIDVERGTKVADILTPKPLTGLAKMIADANQGRPLAGGDKNSDRRIKDQAKAADKRAKAELKADLKDSVKPNEQAVKDKRNEPKAAIVLRPGLRPGEKLSPSEVGIADGNAVALVQDIQGKQANGKDLTQFLEGVLNSDAFRRMFGIGYSDLSTEHRKMLTKGGESDFSRLVDEVLVPHGYISDTGLAGLQEFNDKMELALAGKRQFANDANALDIPKEVAGAVGIPPAKMRDALAQDKGNEKELKIREYLAKKDPYDVEGQMRDEDAGDATEPNVVAEDNAPAPWDEPKAAEEDTGFLKAQQAPKGFGEKPKRQFNRDKSGQGILPGDIAFAGANVETKVTPDKTKAEEARDLARAEAEAKADAAKQRNLGEGEKPSFARKLSADQSKDLILQHNLTAANLIHADKMGGLAVPSMAVAKRDMPLENFGEITLLGDRALADPKESGMQVFSGDIYSPRYPNVIYQIKDHKALYSALKEAHDVVGFGNLTDDLKKTGSDALSMSNPAVTWAFLKSKGIEPDVKTDALDSARTEELRSIPGMEKFFGRDHYNLRSDPEFMKLALEDQRRTYARLDQETQKILGHPRTDEQKRNIAMHLAYEVASAESKKVDRSKTRDALRDQIKAAGLEREFEAFRAALFEKAGATSKIRLGYTYSGNDKTKAHTLENVVAIMKKNMKSGENFSYGPANVRAAVAPRFRSLDEIRANKDRLISQESFDKIKEEVNAEFSKVEDLMPGHPPGALVNVMVDAARMGIPRALQANGWTATPRAQQAMGEFMEKLKSLPTAYFESKLPRAVGIEEFKVAVIPSDTDPRAVAILEKKGLRIERYKKDDPADRKRAIKAASEDVAFERRDGQAMTEAQWKHYNGLTDAERARLYPEVYRKSQTVNGAGSGVRVVDFEQDVDPQVIKMMEQWSAALASKVGGVVQMLRRHVPNLRFGGFTPAGNLHGVNVDGKVFINQLATHQLALKLAKKERITYEEAYAREMSHVLIHEAAHYAEKGHGDAFKAEMARIQADLGPQAIASILKDLREYASNEQNRTRDALMYEKALPGWKEGERRGREAAARADARTEGRSGADAEQLERLPSKPRGDTGSDSDAREDDGRGGRLPVFGREQTGRVAAASGVRGSDGRVAPETAQPDTPDFSRKPSAEEAPSLQASKEANSDRLFRTFMKARGADIGQNETKLQFLQRKGQNRLNSLDRAEAAVKAKRGDTSAPELADHVFGAPARIDNKLLVAESLLLTPIVNEIKAGGLNFDTLGGYMRGEKDAIEAVSKSGKKAKYDASAQKIEAIYDIADDYRLEAGLVTKDDLEDIWDTRAAARAESTTHPIYDALQDLERAIIDHEHNLAMDSIAKFSEKEQDSDFATVGKVPKEGPTSGAVTFRRGGQKMEIRFSDPLVAQSVKNLYADRLEGFTRMVSGATRWTSRINTILSPTFAVKNKIRDYAGAVLSAMVLHGAPNGVSKSVASKIAFGQLAAQRGTREFLKNPAKNFEKGSDAWWAKQAHANAAVPGYFKSVESLQRLESRLGDTLRSGLAKNMSFRRFGDLMMGISQISEASTRVSVYRALVEAGETPQRAGALARNTLDTNKSGEWTRNVGALTPFFNSSVQGASRLVQMLTSADPEVKKRARMMLGGLVASGFALGAWLSAEGGDDDKDGIPDSDQHAEWDDQRNLIIGEARIPLPQGFSAPFYAGFVMSKMSRGNAKPAASAANVAKAFWDQFTPISSPFGVAQPVADLLQNKTFSGAPIRPIRYPGQTKPDSEMSFKSNSGASKFVAKGLNKLTGGDEAESGYIDLSPGNIDYIAKAGLGAFGKFMSDSYHFTADLAAGKPSVKSLPVLKDFMFDEDRNIQSRYYDAAQAIKDADDRRRGKEKIALKGELIDRNPSAEDRIDGASLTELKKAMRGSGSSLSPERRAWLMKELESEDGRSLRAKDAFKEASDRLKAIENMPDGPDKDAKKRAIYEMANRAFVAAVKGK